MQRVIIVLGSFLAKTSFSYVSLHRLVQTRVLQTIQMSHESTTTSRSSLSIDDDIRCFLQSVYEAERQNMFSLYTTGGGASSISWIFSVPGASRSVLEASVPYGRSALNRVLGCDEDSQIQSFCSMETANRMASSALKSSVEMILLETKDLRKLYEMNIIGVGCTAAIASSTPKRGEHRCFVSYAKANAHIFSAEITMTKGSRSREDEDYLCSRMILDTLQSSLSTDINDKNLFVFTNKILKTDEVVVQCIENRSLEVIDDVREKRSKMCLFVPSYSDSDYSAETDDFVCYENVVLPPGSLIYPGSFNPLHTGHVELAVASLKLMDRTGESRRPPLIFEISAANADKAPLERDEIIRRLRQFRRCSDNILANAGVENYGVCITSEPLFRAKSEIFRNCRFILGADTLSRLINTKYYQNSGNLMISALQIMYERGCSFIVGGRVVDKDDEQLFESLEDIIEGLKKNEAVYDNEDIRDVLINLLHSMSMGISEDDFRVDLSSTEIRMKMNNP